MTINSKEQRHSLGEKVDSKVEDLNPKQRKDRPLTMESLEGGRAKSKTPYLRDTLEVRIEKFWSQVDRGNDDECWIWTGCKRKNRQWQYGAFYLFGRQLPTHVVSFILHGGSVPKGNFVCHHCDNTVCVNPNHLFCSPPKGNTQDMVKKDRHCRGSRRYNAKFKEADVLKIRAMYRPGKFKGSFGCRRIAKLYGVWPQVITDIIRRVTWKHI